MLPDTSLEAYRAVTNEQLRDIYIRIKDALKVLGRANYDTIATHLNLPDKNMVSRRTKEMEGLEMIYKPGTKSLTSRKRNAYDYAIRNENTVIPLPERFNNNELKAVDFANVLISKTKIGKLKQAALFLEGLEDEK